MSIEPRTTVTQGARTASRVIDGKAVVVVIDANVMHVLNPVGARIWQLCDGRTVESIARTVEREFMVDGETAMRDVTGFLQDLTRIGALEVRAQ